MKTLNEDIDKLKTLEEGATKSAKVDRAIKKLALLMIDEDYDIGTAKMMLELTWGDIRSKRSAARDKSEYGHVRY